MADQPIIHRYEPPIIVSPGHLVPGDITPQAGDHPGGRVVAEAPLYLGNGAYRVTYADRTTARIDKLARVRVTGWDESQKEARERYASGYVGLRDATATQPGSSR